ncbi:helix-turn-helix domain-containing protein [Cronobacter sakazakii]|uniref:helix-turn-helix domain-containing protein n=1 Tax=Cronobacter sakazakii TaxID=28141 RepID=UPI000DA1974C|nr:helix-turn-helix domain-containing protein [Cronobacter sakazakii]EGT4353466.1 helix-turn-helix domain-containing protein [Cronobacter sakazakii]EIZ9234822.1 helix-turn-helix domain-containing protein [Cronobacter sakazakii]ELY2470809.1 helix-turn-helix domain-containing protein [Cronobacter sakazakii]ELY2491873.1 helix-turn-helix domain-containing protein [Cronobacter sakazakii]ELY2661061.1 helix-turn-helix domain-containing protein [Cronobacter sakazakii]
MKEKPETAQYETSAKRIKQVLYELGWNQSQLAKEIGVSAQAVQLWAKGASRPNGPNLTRLSEATGKPEAWFFSEEEQPQESVRLMDPVLGASAGTELLPLTEEEIRLITVYRQFPSVEAKNMLLAFEMRYKQLYEFFMKYANQPKK